MEFTDLVPFRNRRRSGGRSAALTPFERMHEEIDRLFDDFLPQFPGARGLESQPGLLASVDVSETEDAVEVNADLPGMEESDIDVTYRDGSLLISGERKHEKEEKKKNYYHAERAYGAFSRSIPLPCEVDEDRIEAQFRKGVLTVHLPKSRNAKENQRKIEIKAS